MKIAKECDEKLKTAEEAITKLVNKDGEVEILLNLLSIQPEVGFGNFPEITGLEPSILIAEESNTDYSSEYTGL